jgi:ATP-dependent DNA helicase DinG
VNDPILAVLGAGGRLARVIPAHEERPQQLDMARRVRKALEERHHLLVEAGTGTGKTLAYLLPAVLSGRRVVVSTATKTLQEQIYFKDVPLLARALGRPIRAAYMKGRSNYLCRTRFAEFSKDPTFPSRDEASRFPEIVAWADKTETGDRAELSLPDHYGAWREMSATADTCTGIRCPEYETCFVTRMRREAQEADVVVVNHHLFFADLALRTRGEQGIAQLIPRYEAVIFDEAHALEEIATDYFGVQVSTWRFEELVRDATRAASRVALLPSAAAPSLARLGGRAKLLFEAAERAAGLPPPRRGQVPDGTARLAAGALDGCAQETAELLAALEETAKLFAEAGDIAETEAIARRCHELAADLSFVVDAEEQDDFVYFLERRGRGAFLRAAPIEVAGELSRRLYRTVDTAVFASATLAVAGRFDFVKRRLGLFQRTDDDGLPVGDGPVVDELVVGSPFDYRRQAALYTPPHLPEPNDPSFLAAAVEEMEALVNLVEGGAFLLFTSVRNMERAYQNLAPRLPFPSLLQGELPKRELLARFREEPSVLFATASFWEGVDVPGDALRLVVIDRLPFASPGDPVVAARVEAIRSRGGEPFSSYQVPQAAIALRQGFGRLIRTASDRGVVAILDRRIVVKGYGRTFVRALPPCPRFAHHPDLATWWDGA